MWVDPVINNSFGLWCRSLSFPSPFLMWYSACSSGSALARYQKQLQQSYLAMYQRNQRLEKALQQLARGDGAGEPFEIDLEGADIPYEDIIATEI